MLLWLLIPIPQAAARPIVLVPVAFNSTNPFDSEHESRNSSFSEEADIKRNATKLIDPSIFITLREDDWRDNHHDKKIIWSIESIHHPDHGKNYPKGKSERMSVRSQVTSFLILGSVIGFIIYTYLSHVITMRRINRQLKAAQLRELVQRSAMIMASSAQQNQLNLQERRHSLINMFKGFKL
ncbi:hypothetical protein RB195_009205 [Necator americanus]|uniref:Uncharacterized protein n=1 Tax=Necator americanus TaxID=51031 RepID=A0ABR1CSA8_NECAM